MKWLVEVSLVCHRFAKVSSHRSSGSSEEAAEIFYVTLQDRLIKESGDFMEKELLILYLQPPKIGNHHVLVDRQLF